MKINQSFFYLLLFLFLCSGGYYSLAQSNVQNSVGEAEAANIVLCRPTDNSITVSLLPLKGISVYFEYSRADENYPYKTETQNLIKGLPQEFVLTNLTPNTSYKYRIRYSEHSSSEFLIGDEHFFHTQRTRGSSFVFTIQADSHLYDKKGNASLMKIALQNQLNDKPDFLIDLGDTFGDDHHPFNITNEEIQQLHLNFRSFAGQICHSIPFLFCIGNHEGESGYYLLQTPPNNIAVYETLARKKYFPNPVPNEFYSGNTHPEENGIGLPENYFAWEWGDALFVVLDAYRYYTANAKPRNWDWTIGKEQYDWFKNTLESSSAKYKIVITHHILGETRGAAAVAKYAEWGGYNQKDVWEFDSMRPGWELPIHQLMVKNGVNIFIHGHDHLFVKEIVDGIIYQEAPMPSDSTYQIGMVDNGDAYGGDKLDGSGHIRVNVSPDSLFVEYVAAYLAKDEDVNHKNGATRYSYSVKPNSTTSVTENKIPSQLMLEQNYPNPFNPITKINYSLAEPGFVTLKVYDILGKEVITLVNEYQSAGKYSAALSLNNINSASGTYFYQLRTNNKTETKKAVFLK